MHVPQRGFSFGPYLIDAVRRLVWMEGRLLPVTGKAFEILLFLVEHRDRVVEKDELLKAIWPDTFVQENSLVRHVSTLRRALGQKPDQHDCILTVQGRGYQFVAAVTELDVIPAGLPTESTPPPPAVSMADNTPTDVELAPALRHSTRPPWLALAAMAVVVLGVSAATAFLIVNHRTHVAASSLPVIRQITYGPNSHLQPTWSPDGASLAYASDRSGNFDIWVQRLDGSEPVQVTHAAAEEWQPAWSPDGQWLAFRSEQDGGGLFVVSLNGGMVRRVSDFGYEPRWSPDGSRIMFASAMVARRPRRRFFSVAVDGGRPQEVRPDLTSAITTTTAAWTPDGRVTIWGMAHGTWSLVTATLDGRDATSFTIDEDVARQAHELGLEPIKFNWSPDGKYVVFDGVVHGARNLWRVAADLAHASMHGPFERLTTSGTSDQDVAFSADGRQLAFSSTSERTRIWSYVLGGDGRIAGSGVPVTSGGSGEFDAAVSDDGQRLIYRTTRDGRQELWVRSLSDGAERRLITGDDGERTSPRWSPDGTRVAYLLNSRPAGNDGTLVVFAMNEMREQALTAPGAPSLVPDDWSRDGALILGPCRNAATSTFSACVAAAVAPSQVHAIATDPTQNFRSLRFSPDQRWISAVAFGPGGTQDASAIVVVPSNGGPLIPMTAGTHYDQKPIWGRDGRTVYFVSNRDGFFNVWGRHFDGDARTAVGEPFRVTSLTNPRQIIATDLNRLEIAVAAQHLYVPVTERTGEIFILQNLSR